MKKIICLALITIMTLSLVISVSASAADYTTAEDGDVLYEVDFGATDGYKFIDGRGSSWNLTNPQVSDDGKSVTLEYTDTVRDGEISGTGRARYCTNMLSDFDVKGRSYTIQFTIESDAYVGIALDGNTTFAINPTLNAVSLGQSHYLTHKGIGEITYEGTGNKKQTYAIEMTCSDELAYNHGGVEAYLPTVYRLFVLDETADAWCLVRELSVDKGIDRFEWEKDYEYFYIAIIRYGSDDSNFDADGNAVKSTVSDMTIYKGIDFLTKGEPLYVEPEETPEEEPDPDGSENDGTTGGGSVTVTPKPSNKDSNNSTNKDTTPETEANTEAETEAEGGCGSVVGGASVALISALAAGVAVKSRKKKEN